MVAYTRDAERRPLNVNGAEAPRPTNVTVARRGAYVGVRDKGAAHLAGRLARVRVRVTRVIRG